MTEQHMPARIWVRICGGGVSMPSGRAYTTLVGEDREKAGRQVFVRADIAERMAEALEDWLNYAEDNISEFDLEECFADAETTLCPRCRSNGCIKQKFDAARDALSAFRSATQDTEARHE